MWPSISILEENRVLIQSTFVSEERTFTSGAMHVPEMQETFLRILFLDLLLFLVFKKLLFDFFHVFLFVLIFFGLGASPCCLSLAVHFPSLTSGPLA